jgi:hypothetical protein
VRRLYYEAYVMATADLKRRVTRSNDDVPTSMPNAEREERRTATKKRLTGLDIAGDLDPSNELLDLAASMGEMNTVSYIPWERCTTRDQELDRPAGAAHKNYWKPDAQGFLKEARQPLELSADLHGNHMSLKLQHALTRRALALDMVGLMSYEHGDMVTKYLMKKYLAQPPDARYVSPSIEQVRRADTHIWKTLAQLCRTGIRRDVNGQLPLEVHIGEALKEFDLALIMTPMLNPNQGSKAKERRDEPLDQPPNKARNRQNKKREAFQRAKKERDDAVERANRAEAAQRRPNAIAVRAADDRPRDDMRGTRMPRELIGMLSRTVDGKPICYAFNMGCCRDAAAAGTRCPKGWHVCCENIGGKACGKPHAALPQRNASEH